MDQSPAATKEPTESLEHREEAELLEALRRATIGEYDIYSQLGRGGMATVFLALELSLNRPVAIKVISPSALSSTTVIERFWLEARTAAALSHPHVIPIFAVRSVHGLHFFVMKHIQGGSLEVVLKNEGPFAFWLARTVLGQVAGALAYAHRRGVVHRDIKPANIMLDDEGFAVVMDFGIAKVRDAAALTASGSMVGTPFYMSPEQFNGTAVDGRSDQYSLGVVAFELLTGQRPFKGDTIPAVLRGHLIDKVPDVRDFRKDCPTSLATLVHRMMCKTSTDRFPSMEAVCAQLDSMPRINADKAREKIISLARTASMSSPQISEPVSPSPISRTSAERIVAAAPPLPPPSRSASLAASIRKRPVVSGVALVGIVAFTSLALTSRLGTTQRVKDSETSSATQGDSLRRAASTVTPLQNPPAALAFTAPEDSGKAAASHPPAGALKSVEAPVAKVVDPLSRPARKNESNASKPLQQRHNRPNDEDTGADAVESAARFVPTPLVPDATVIAPAPPPPPPPPPTAFGIGSRMPAAFLYVDGEQVGRIGRLRFFEHPAGRVHIQIQAEDCLTWDSVFVLKANDTTTIGYRNPRCNR